MWSKQEVEIKGKLYFKGNERQKYNVCTANLLIRLMSYKDVVYELKKSMSIGYSGFHFYFLIFFDVLNMTGLQNFIVYYLS